MIGVGGKSDSNMLQQKVGEISDLRKEALEDPWVAADGCVCGGFPFANWNLKCSHKHCKMEPHFYR